MDENNFELEESCTLDEDDPDVVNLKLTNELEYQLIIANSKIFDGTDGCVAPVLSIAEAPHHHHLKDRNTFIELDGHFQPAPAPRFSLTKESVRHGPPKCGQDNAAISKKFKLDESKLT